MPSVSGIFASSDSVVLEVAMESFTFVDRCCTICEAVCGSLT